MTVYLCNKEPIDIRTITLMGVSVKTKDNPIGYFGTGLKYALATLLRTGHKVTLYLEGSPIDFGTQAEKIRGQDFEVIFMQERGKVPVLLPFTTALGRNWEVWQAYRELRSNCMDEEGIITTGLEAWAGKEHGTIFAVTGDAFEKCHTNSHEIFLTGQPLINTGAVAIHQNNNMNRTVFYRGVRASATQQPSLFTYNLNIPIDLTEDRTIKNPFFIEYYAKIAIMQCDDEDLIERIIMAPKDTFEYQMDFDKSVKPSHAFMNAVERNHKSGHCNATAISVWLHHSYQEPSYDPVPLDDFELKQLKTALKLFKRLTAVDFELGRDFIVVDGLGEGIFGMVRHRTILISKACFDMGHRFVASTLYEEWLHKFQMLKDEDRNMQNFLFEKLFAMTERLVELEGTR